MADSSGSPPARVPVTVLGGYLGAGKTTVLRSVLTAPHGLRIAVVVNDFGELSIDAALIADRDADRIELANGCACCQVGDALAEAFFALAEHTPAYDRIIVEASGVADPATVAGWASLPGLRLDGIVVIADATTIADQVLDRYVGDIVRHQIATADLLVLSKTDLTDGPTLDRARACLQTDAPTTPLIESDGSPPIEALFDLDHTAGPPGPVSHADRFVSVVWSSDRPLDPAGLAAALSSTVGLVRAKGFVRTGDGVMLVHAVGHRVNVTAWHGATPEPLSVVLIGLRDQFDPSAMTTLLDRAAGPG